MDLLQHALTQVVQQSSDEIYIVTPEFRFVYANDAALRNLGYSMEELRQLSPTDISAPGNLEEQWELSHTLDGNGSDSETDLHFKNLHRRKDGSFYPAETRLRKLDCQGSTLYVGTVQDLSDRQQTQDKLNLIFEAADIGYWESDLENNSYTLSDRSLQMLGYQRGELPSTLDGFLALVHPDDLKRVISNAERHAASSRNWTTEYRLKHKSGHWCWIRGTSRITERDPVTGKVNRLCGTHIDFTLEKRLEAEQQKAQKLASLGVLAGGIAHDFNNILTILFGNISLARMRQEQGLSCLEALGNAEHAFRRARHLTTQLLTFAKGGDPVRENVSIGELIEEIIAFDLSGSKVKAEFTQADDLWIADVDRGLVAQVFSNLATNANQAMPEGGHLYISARNFSADSEDSSGLNPGRYLEFRMRDEGDGIPESQINQIFDPYYTTRENGSGLGLATVYSVIRKHGGRISVSSEVGVGTEFRFFLPAADELTAPKETGSQEARPNREQMNILVVDDEQLICSLARDILQNDGHRVSFALNSGKALELYRNALDSPTPFDLVILDLTLPGGMGGEALLKELRKLHPEICAVVTSGYSTDPVLANFGDYGFRDCLAKPFTGKALRRVVGRFRPR